MFCILKVFKSCNVSSFNIFFMLRRATRINFPCCKKGFGHVFLIIFNEIQMVNSPPWLWIFIYMCTPTCCVSLELLLSENQEYLLLPGNLLALPDYSEEHLNQILIHQWFHCMCHSYLFTLHGYISKEGCFEHFGNECSFFK